MPKPKSQPTPPQPELVYVPEDGPPPNLFVIWSSPLESFLAADGQGWTTSVLRAGTFTEERARELTAETFTARPLSGALAEALAGANPFVLQAIATLGGR